VASTAKTAAWRGGFPKVAGVAGAGSWSVRRTILKAFASRAGMTGPTTNTYCSAKMRRRLSDALTGGFNQSRLGTVIDGPERA